jgi:hypothetical protein
MVHNKNIKLNFVSGIINFQANRGRPIEYFVKPLNDFIDNLPHEHNIFVFLDNKDIESLINTRATIFYIDVDEEIRKLVKDEDKRKEDFLNKFNNDAIWYELSKIYHLKVRMLKIIKDIYEADKVVWLDAGMPCSHLFGHSYNNYKNIYDNNTNFLCDVMKDKNFLSQESVVMIQYGIAMSELYKLFNLRPSGKEHTSGCLFSISYDNFDNFYNEYYNYLDKLIHNNYHGTDENILAVLLIDKIQYIKDMYYNYGEFMLKIQDKVR